MRSKQQLIHISRVGQEMEPLRISIVRSAVLPADRHSRKRVAGGTRRDGAASGRDGQERTLSISGVDDFDVWLDGRRAARVGVRAEGVVGEDLVHPFRAQDAIEGLGIDDRRLRTRRAPTGVARITCCREGRGAASSPSNATCSVGAGARSVRSRRRAFLRLKGVQEVLYSYLDIDGVFRMGVLTSEERAAPTAMPPPPLPLASGTSSPVDDGPRGTSSSSSSMRGRSRKTPS